MKTSPRARSRWMTWVICVFLLLLSPLLWSAIYALQMAPFPRGLSGAFYLARGFLFLAFPASALASLAAFCTLPVLVVSRFVPRFRAHQTAKKCPLAVLVCLMFLACSFFSIRPMMRLRERGIPNMARNGEPLIAAIERYKTQNKNYPDSLNQLVPNYIAEIPYTGAVGYPDFEYGRLQPDENVAQETYLIYVSTPNGGINFDKFMYSPNQQYIRRTHERSGSLKPFSDWLYLYE